MRVRARVPVFRPADLDRQLYDERSLPACSACGEPHFDLLGTSPTVSATNMVLALRPEGSRLGEL